MPVLPIPLGTPLSGGDLVVVSDADILAVLPLFLKPGDPAVVRDALIAALREILLRYQVLTAYAADQCDIATATGEYLESLANERDVFKQPGEDDEVLRARVLTAPELVTPTAILAAANAILAALTTVKAEYFESALDRMFLTNGSASFHSFFADSPQYPDRLYKDDAPLNGGVYRANARPGGPWLFSDNVGRYFVLRVPAIDPADVALAYDGTKLATTDAAVPELGGGDLPFAGALQLGQLPPNSGGRGPFLADGSNTSGAEADGSDATFLYTGVSDPVSIYQSIANAVERIKAHSIRWQLFVDPTLS